MFSLYTSRFLGTDYVEMALRARKILGAFHRTVPLARLPRSRLSPASNSCLKISICSYEKADQDLGFYNRDLSN